MSKDNENNGEIREDVKLVVLKLIDKEYDLIVAKALLEDNNIPFIVKNYGSGGYMRIIGRSSMYKTEILVEESTFEKAKSILDDVFLEEED